MNTNKFYLTFILILLGLIFVSFGIVEKSFWTAIIGIVITLIGFFPLFSLTKRRKDFLKTKATILDFNAERYDVGTNYSLKINYLVKGKEYNKKVMTDESTLSSLCQKLEKGVTQIEITYNPKNPHEFLLVKNNSNIKEEKKELEKPTPTGGTRWYFLLILSILMFYFGFQDGSWVFTSMGIAVLVLAFVSLARQRKLARNSSNPEKGKPDIFLFVLILLVIATAGFYFVSNIPAESQSIDITGNYTLTSDSYRHGDFEISKDNKGNFFIDLQLVEGAEAQYQGRISGSLKVTKNGASFHNAEGGIDCAFDISFEDNSAEIISTRRNCGFDDGLLVDGLFAK